MRLPSTKLESYHFATLLIQEEGEGGETHVKKTQREVQGCPG